jgi:phage shock protein A
MSLNDRLDAVLRHQLELVRELRRSRDELAVVQSRVRMRLAEFEEQAGEVREHHREAVAEGDPQAGALEDWPDRIQARIEELGAAAAELEAAEAGILDRIHRAEADIEDFRVLQPQIIARVAAARSAGLGREIFETLADALRYVDIALAAAAAEDPNGPLKQDRSTKVTKVERPGQ